MMKVPKKPTLSPRSLYPKVGLTELYAYYVKLSGNPLGRGAFKELISEIHADLWEAIITELWLYKLPFNLGVLYVREDDCDKGGLASGATYIDWQASRAAGKHVRRYNTHTNGRRFSITMKNVRRNSGVRHRGEYAFAPTRTRDCRYSKNRLRNEILSRANDSSRKDYRAYPKL